MDTVQWPQERVVKPMEEIIPNTWSKPGLERKIRPQKEQASNCPRCNSTNTKFCYYNNYSLSQPRYFCKTCRRYWTEGGSLRNIPVGGGSRKNKRISSSSSSSSLVSSKKPPHEYLVTAPNSQSCQNTKDIHEGQDLNLGFPAAAISHDFKSSISELVTVPNFDSTNNNKKNHIPSSSSSSSSSSLSTSPHLSALELFTGFTSRGVINSFMHMPNNITDPNNNVYSSGFPLPAEFKPSLNFSLDGLGNSGYNGSLQGVQETNGIRRLLFPFVDLKVQVSNPSSEVDQNRDQTGYWNGMLAGGSW